MPKPTTSGFTLAELLIALTILGVIAVFTIPKILITQQNSRYNAEAHEIVGMVSGAYQMAKLRGDVDMNSSSKDLTPFLNYVSMDTSGTQIDAHPSYGGSEGGGIDACIPSNPCFKLHNGGVLRMNAVPFGGTTTTNLVEFNFDPDGVPANSTSPSAPGKTIAFQLYYDGMVTTRAKLRAGVGWGDGPFDPTWFSW